MLLPDPFKPLDQQQPIVLLAMCIYGEARNQTDRAKYGVGHVVANRVKTRTGFGSSWSAVLLQKNAFSCFLCSDPNNAKLLDPLRYDSAETWEDCLDIAMQVFRNDSADPTDGAVFYHDATMSCPPASHCIDVSRGVYRSKEWGDVAKTVRIDSLTFYKQV